MEWCECDEGLVREVLVVRVEWRHVMLRVWCVGVCMVQLCVACCGVSTFGGAGFTGCVAWCVECTELVPSVQSIVWMLERVYVSMWSVQARGCKLRLRCCDAVPGKQ
jgi:hypothetical protein